MSADGDTTALLVQLRLDAEYVELLRERDVLREQDVQRDLSAAEQADIARLDDQILTRREIVTAEQHETLKQIRGLLDAHRDMAGIRVGGVPMIVDDMLDLYSARCDRVRQRYPGIFLTLLLFVIFVRPRWVLSCPSVAAWWRSS